MLAHFALVLILLLVGILFVFGALFAGKFFRPCHPSMVKGEIYECGEPAVGPAWINFNIRFYLVALIFVIFDVEAALIFPVAAAYKGLVTRGLGMIAFIEIFLFVAVLFVGLIYAWAKRDLDWIKTESGHAL